MVVAYMQRQDGLIEDLQICTQQETINYCIDPLSYMFERLVSDK